MFLLHSICVSQKTTQKEATKNVEPIWGITHCNFFLQYQSDSSEALKNRLDVFVEMSLFYYGYNLKVRFV